jgi:DNA polymerase III subunit delta
LSVLREDGFESALKRGFGQLNGLLVHGADSAAIANMGRRVVRAVAGPNAEADRFEASVLKDGAGRIEDEFFSLSLLGDRKLIWIDDVGDQHLKVLAGVIGAVATANFVFLAADSLSKTSKLRLACEEASGFGALALYEENSEAGHARLQVLLAKEEMSWGDGADEAFFESVGSERSIVTQEFEKLILYCLGQKVISADDVLAICGETATAGADQLIDSMLAGDLAGVDRKVETLDSDGGGMRTILVTVNNHLTRLQDLRGVMDSGSSADQVVKAARPPIFFKRQNGIASQLKRFDGAALITMQATVAAAIFETRKNADLADAITSRTLLSLARLARSKSV